MPNLFGVDIAQEIANAFRGELVPGVLDKITPGTRTTGKLTAGTNSESVSHTFEGFLEVKEVRRKGQVGAEPMSVLTIITNSISPATTPEVNDKATIESLTLDITEILDRDPAAAVFECLVQ